VSTVRGGGGFLGPAGRPKKVRADLMDLAERADHADLPVRAVSLVPGREALVPGRDELAPGRDSVGTVRRSFAGGEGGATALPAAFGRRE
jgi:hypothetical protein